MVRGTDDTFWIALFFVDINALIPFWPFGVITLFIGMARYMYLATTTVLSLLMLFNLVTYCDVYMDDIISDCELA